MTTEQFIKELKTKFSFKNQSKNFAFVNIENDKILAYNSNMKSEIRAINYLKINNKTLGFGMDRILDLESNNELLSISGTSKKDGLYYLDHESPLITVEELETDEDAKVWIEDYLNVDMEAYSQLTADKKVMLFEKWVGIFLVEKNFQAFFDKIKIVIREEFFGKAE